MYELPVHHHVQLYVLRVCTLSWCRLLYATLGAFGLFNSLSSHTTCKTMLYTPCILIQCHLFQVSLPHLASLKGEINPYFETDENEDRGGDDDGETKSAAGTRGAGEHGVVQVLRLEQSRANFIGGLSAWRAGGPAAKFIHWAQEKDPRMMAEVMLDMFGVLHAPLQREELFAQKGGTGRSVAMGFRNQFRRKEIRTLFWRWVRLGRGGRSSLW